MSDATPPTRREPVFNMPVVVVACLRCAAGDLRGLRFRLRGDAGLGPRRVRLRAGAPGDRARRRARPAADRGAVDPAGHVHGADRQRERALVDACHLRFPAWQLDACRVQLPVARRLRRAGPHADSERHDSSCCSSSRPSSARWCSSSPGWRASCRSSAPRPASPARWGRRCASCSARRARPWQFSTGARSRPVSRSRRCPWPTSCGTKAALLFILVWFGTNLVFGLYPSLSGISDGPIAWQAHIGGFLAGLLAFPAVRPTPAGAEAGDRGVRGSPHRRGRAIARRLTERTTPSSRASSSARRTGRPCGTVSAARAGRRAPRGYRNGRSRW